MHNIAKEKLCLEQSLYQMSADELNQTELINPEITVSPIRKNNISSTKFDLFFGGKKLIRN